jgi:hypothetical protein
LVERVDPERLAGEVDPERVSGERLSTVIVVLVRVLVFPAASVRVTLMVLDHSGSGDGGANE